jgi:FMN-dependent oxidoreductase (nitrilotriacetate monooxygenase family)
VTPRPIRLNAFDMNCVVHQSPGLWRHPADRAWRYKDLSYWLDLARLLERGRFDALFIADVLGVYDVYGASRDAALRHGTQVPVNDPLLLVPAMATVTDHLGFGVTASTGFEHPYPFARRMSTLDHLTDGRAGWNVVTSYLESGARNMGMKAQASHDERYDVADEYLEVCYALWEGSWENGAVVRDREQGVFADPAKVHPIEHDGRWFDVPGIHLSEPSRQRTPVIFQAGASGRGRRFAGRHAEAIFTSGPTIEVIAPLVAQLREELRAAGREAGDARVYTMATVIVDETSQAAHAKHDELRRYASPEAALVLLSGWTGIDLSGQDLDAPLQGANAQAIQSAASVFMGCSTPEGRQWTLREIADWAGIGGRGPVFVGSPGAVADAMQEWVDAADVDGFNLAYAITPGTVEDVVEHLVPELQRRGVHRRDYEDSSLRDRLFGAGDRLPGRHPGARFRRAPTPST